MTNALTLTLSENAVSNLTGLVCVVSVLLLIVLGVYVWRKTE